MKHILDTDHATLYQQGHPALGNHLANLPQSQIATTVVTYEEQIEGRLSLVRRARTREQRVQAHYWLQRTLGFFCRIPVLPLDEAAAAEFERLRALKLRVGTQDLLIAAIAITNKATLLTRNLRDFSRVPSLVVADWSLPLDE
ncbi:MAG: type II toxin-antitoxin system VapC family toxin [Chloroflexi bacterium]|nr:type II toxin-antitoxin system VapC family toxin [Chloroflexota bacterium]MBI3763454.1 type II toxin-antitoxin system VapC family toxin [Chloroflexota bacterium]